ncbi:MAG: hypothetical protein EA383_02445 [Spirochaetaceae bacterium]|nr:MAG: hypothetical protein EA383_02445 [Spirochaetaceae bacterium]
MFEWIKFIASVSVVLVTVGCGTDSEPQTFDAGIELAERWGIPRPAVVAHRGASGIAPESTVAAYEMGRDVGAHYLEADLQRTKDGEIIVFHDETLERTTNVEDVFPDRVDEPVQEFTLAELKELDHGSWFNEAYPERARESFDGLSVVTLQELIEVAENGANNPGLYLETKSVPNHPGIEEDIVGILEDAGWLPGPREIESDEDGSDPVHIIFQSFYDDSVASLRELVPDEIPVVLLSSDAADMKAAHERGLLVHHYTVNEVSDMQRLHEAGSDGIFTDWPHTALETYGIVAAGIDVDGHFEILGYRVLRVERSVRRKRVDTVTHWRQLFEMMKSDVAATIYILACSSIRTAGDLSFHGIGVPGAEN